MTWRTHFLGGMASLWAFPAVGMAVTAPAIIGAALGSLFPDLDSRASKIASLSILDVRPFVPVSAAVRAICRHRGAVHSVIGLAVSTALVAYPLWRYVGAQAVAGFALGFASHLILDMATVRGLRVFWPERKVRRIMPKRLRIATGGVWEELYLALAGCASLLLMVKSLT